MNGYTDLTTNIENSRNCLRRIARHDDQEFSNQSILNVMEKFVKTVNAMDETILVPCRLMDRQVGDSADTVPLPFSSTTITNSQNNSNSKYHQYGKNKKKNATVRDYLNSSDLFNLYNMLNNVKVDLLWGRNNVDENDNDDDDQGVDTTSTISLNTTATVAAATSTTSTATNDEQTIESKTSTTNNNETGGVKGHIRRPSTVSITSSNSISTLSDDSESEISNENDSGIESEGNHEHDKSVELSKQFRSHLLGLYKCLEQMTDTANYLTARYQSDVGGNV